MKVAKRAAAALIMVYVVTSLTFFLIRLMPGSPYSVELYQLMQQGYSQVQAENQVHVLFGFQTQGPLVVQYGEYLANLVHGNLGTSIMYPGESVLGLIAKAVPWTVLVVSIALLVSFGIGILLGTLAAYLRGGWFDQITTIGSSLLNGVPQYLTAILLFYFFATQARLFPIGGAYSPNVLPGFSFAFVGSVFYHALLPIGSFVLSSFAGWALLMKSSTVSVLGEDFIVAAKAMAINERSIVVSYVSKNAILPLFTSLLLSLGFMFGGSVFVEQIFNYPGLGQLFLNSTNARDFPLMQGCFLLLTTAVIVANFLADLLYSRLDPRIRQ